MKNFVLVLFITFWASFSANAQKAVWAERIAGTEEDNCTSIAVDVQGNVYVAGYFNSPTLTLNNGITLIRSGSASYPDAYIAKYNASGLCQWAQKIGETYWDYASSIAIDASGNVFVAGYFYSGILTLNNGITLSNSGSGDGYIAKYNSSGLCQWAQKIAGADYENVSSITIDASGNIYVAGEFKSGSLTFNNGITLTNSGYSDVYIAKYNSSGLCQWAQKVAGTNTDIANSIAVDTSGNVYVAGLFESSTLTLNNGIALTKSGGYDDAGYIAKYNSSGLCQWAQEIGGIYYDYAKSIAVDASGNVYVAGYFGSDTLTLNNGTTLANSGGWDGYIAKYNSSGLCQWAQEIGGIYYDYAKSIAVDARDNIYVVGGFCSGTLTLNNGITLANSGEFDVYIAKYNSSGFCQWAQKIAGTNDEYAYSIALDASGNVYVAGDFKSSTLTLNNGITLTNSGNYDGYIAKYSQMGLNPSINPPTLVSPTNTSTNISITPTLTWEAVANATSYRVQLSTDSVFANLIVNEVVTTTGKSVSGLVKGMQYYWRVKSLNASDSSGWSEEWSFTTEQAPPDAPILLAPADASTDVSLSPILIWEAVANATSYRVQLSTDGAFTNLIVNEVVTTIGKPVSGLVKGKQYYWRVKSLNASDSSGWSEEWSFTTRPLSSGSPSAVVCVWAEKIAGTDNPDYAENIAVDANGNVYVAGYFNSPTLTFNNGITLVNNGSSDGYIAKYNSFGLCLWAKEIGGTNDDRANSIAVDASGNVYVVGDFKSDTLTLNNGIAITNSGDYDGYIAKYNSSGFCQWAQKIAGIGNDGASGIAVDANGNVYVAGYFNSPTLALNNGITLTRSGYTEGYIAKYDSSGLCQWAQKIGGTSGNAASGIAVDANGNVYVTGYFNSLTLTLSNGITLTNSGDYDGYIAKYNSSGLCQWAEKIAGTNDDRSRSIAVDASGNVYVAGWFFSNTLLLNNSITLTNSGSSDGYIAKYNSSGLCQWAQGIAGIGNDGARSITVDTSGNVYVAGWFSSDTIAFNNGIMLTNANTNSGSSDGYIAKYNSSGLCQWARGIAGTNNEYVRSMAVDSSGNVYVAGWFNSPTLAFNNGITLTNSGNYDGYIVKYNSSGLCQWAQGIVGINDDYARNIAVDSSGNVYVAGWFNSPTLTFNNGITLTNSGDYDVYLAKYDSSGLCQWAEKIAGTQEDEVKSIALDTSGNVYVAGYFGSDTLTLNNGIMLTNSGDYSVYLAKYDSTGLCEWAEKIAGTGSDDVNGIALDASDNVYVVGYFGSDTLTFNNGIALTNSGGSGFYLAKYDSMGLCQWAEKIAGTNGDYANGIALDASGNIYVAGYFGSPTLTFNNGITLTNSGSADSYIAKYDSTGLCQWAEKIAGGSWEAAYSIALDTSDNVYVVGWFESGTLSFNNGITLTNSGSADSYMAKYNSSGLCEWAEKIAGGSWEAAYSIAVDASDNVYVAGWFESRTLLFNSGITLANSGDYDGYIAKYKQIELNPPTLVSPTNASTNISLSPLLIWEAVAGATSYRVQLSASNTFATLLVNDVVAATSKSLSGLANNTQYYWRVQSLNASNSSDWSSVWSFTTERLLLKAPILLYPADASKDESLSPLLIWEAVAGATSYRVQLSASNTFATLLVNDVVAATSKSLSGLANNTQYYWRVQSLNASNSSDWSAVWSFTTEDNGVGVKDDATRTLTITITPQPATTEVMLNLGIASEGEVEVRLFNQAGQLMLQTSDAAANGIIRLNTSDLPSGVYQAMISAGGSVQMARIVIVR